MKTTVYKFFLTLVLTGLNQLTYAQSHAESLGDFDRVLVSPHIELILMKGPHAAVEWEFERIEASKLNAELNGRTLHLYLDQAKISSPLQKNKDHGWNYKESIYKNVRVKAYLTYNVLRSLEVRGSEEVTFKNEVVTDAFKLKIYGDAQVYIPSIKAEDFKAALYGENSLDIGGGEAYSQNYVCYGQNQVRASKFEGEKVSTTIFGESDLNLNANGSMKVTSLGEGKVHYYGDADLNKGLILGETVISRSKTSISSNQ